MSEYDLKKITFGGQLDILSTKRIYKYISFEDGLRYLIEENSLKFNNPNNFNDPFDCNPIIFEIEIPQAELENFIGSLPFDSQQKSYLKKNIRPDKYIDALQYKKNQKRICCFTKTNKSNLMWSHYGDYHKGLCIGFEFPIIYKDDFVLYPVHYPEKFEVVKLKEDTNRVLYYWLMTKSNEWKYEEEVRAINIKDKDYCSFEKENIKEIVIGYKTSNDNLKRLLSKLKKYGYDKNLEINKVDIDKRKLELKIERIAT